MSQTELAQTLSQQLPTRLKKLRQQMFGPRGATQFARQLQISPTTYRRYEKDKLTPLEVLAKAAQITRTDLAWLVTGRKSDHSTPQSIPTDTQALLKRIAQLTEQNPANLQAINRFMDLLAEQTSQIERQSRIAQYRSGWLPILGRSAAGVVFFWQDLPDDSGKTPAQRLSELIEAYLAEPPIAQYPATIQQTPGQTNTPQPHTVKLIQINVPTNAQVSEFLDCPLVRKRYPDAFALRIDGDSMAPQIIHGDLVIVSPSQPPVDGKPAVAQLRDQIGPTCKIYRQEANQLHLIPTNNQYQSTTYQLSQVLWALRVLFRVRVRT